MRVDINKGFEWRGFQKDLLKAFIDSKFLSLMVARQHGKTELGVRAIIDFVFRYQNRKNPVAVIAMKTADQAFDVYFKRLNDILKHLPEKYYVKQGSASSGHIRITLKRPWLNDSVLVEIVGTGNINAIKGRTADFVLLDEMAFLPERSWYTVFAPMLDDTDGRAIITSTINGRNHFYKLCKAFEELNTEGYKRFVHKEYDNHTARYHTPEWIKYKKMMYLKDNRYHEYLQEYMNCPDALSAEEAPFAILCGEARKRYIPLQAYDNIYASIDIGKPGNNPVWVWAKGTKGEIHVIHYKDDDKNQYSVLDRLYRQYPFSNINVIYPDDVSQPSIMEGKKNLQLLQEYVKKQGLGRRLHIRIPLPRTKNRKMLLENTVMNFHNFHFVYEKTQDGLEKLSGAQHKKDKTTQYVDYGEFIKNGNQHCADALMYIQAALVNNYHLSSPRLYSLNDRVRARPRYTTKRYK